MATSSNRSVRFGVFTLVAITVTLLLAFAVSGFASSSPDGLEKVAGDKAIDTQVSDHAFADGPLADYGVSGVDNERLSTGLAGIIGVAATLAIGTGLFIVLRRVRPDRSDSGPPLVGA